MTWFRVDDGLHSHPKWLRVSNAARGLWATAGAWSSDQLTDGRVPVYVLAHIGGTPELAAELVAVGLWHALPDAAEHIAVTGEVTALVTRDGHANVCASDNCSVTSHRDGFVFHDWWATNPTKEKVLDERGKAAERQARARERARAAREADQQRSGDLVSDLASRRASSLGESLGESLRESRGQSRRTSRRDSRVSHRGSHGPPDPTRPDP
jgi:hypothetical protein